MKRIVLFCLVVLGGFFYSLEAANLAESYLQIKEDIFRTLLNLKETKNENFWNISQNYISLFGYQQYLKVKDKLKENIFNTYFLQNIFKDKISKREFFKKLDSWGYTSINSLNNTFLGKIDSYINLLRGPIDEMGNYQWATYKKIPGKSQSFTSYIHTTINSSHKWQTLFATFYKTYLIYIIEPKKRSTFRGNRDFFLKSVEIKYKNKKDKNYKKIIKFYNKWFRRKEYVEIMLDQVYDIVEVKVIVSTKPQHKGKSKLEIKGIQGKLVDIPENPYYPIIQQLTNLKKIRNFQLFEKQLENLAFSQYTAATSQIDPDIYIYRNERAKREKNNKLYLKKDLEYLLYLIETKASYDRLKYELQKMLKQDF